MLSIGYCFIYSGTKYYYVKNLQGAVMSIANADGGIVVNYVYDAWGNVIDITEYFMEEIGAANPIRYRSYYYDTETGFYYLQSRYYDPIIKRFINADKFIAGIGTDFRGANLYLYCFNNPVNMLDIYGNWPTWQDFQNAVKLIFKYVTISASVGEGYGASAEANIYGVPVEASLEVADKITFEAGPDGLVAKYSSIGTANVNIAGIADVGDTVGYGHSYSDPRCNCDMWNGNFYDERYCPANEVIKPETSYSIGASAGAYYIVGADVSVSVDVKGFLTGLIDLVKSAF